MNRLTILIYRLTTFVIDILLIVQGAFLVYQGLLQATPLTLSIGAFITITGLSCLVIDLYRAILASKQLYKIHKNLVVKTLQQHGRLKTLEIAELTGLNINKVYAIIKLLDSEGKIKTIAVKHTSGNHYYYEAL